MANEHHGREDDGAETDAEDAIGQIAAEDTTNNVGPSLERYQLREGGRVDVEILDEVVLKSRGNAGAEGVS